MLRLGLGSDGRRRRSSILHADCEDGKDRVKTGTLRGKRTGRRRGQEILGDHSLDHGSVFVFSTFRQSNRLRACDMFVRPVLMMLLLVMKMMLLLLALKLAVIV